MPYVFGVDGGASSSRALLLTLTGQVVYSAKGPGVNYHEIGASKASATLSKLLQEALQAARARPDECRGVCLGLAGVGRDQDRAILLPVFDNLFGKDKYELMSDAEIALVSGTLSESGIIVLAGTGSMIFGRTENRREGRIGGYGPLLSDEGSGYRIAVEALRAILRSFDGREIPTSLTKMVLDQCKLKSIDDLVDWANSSSPSREKIAAIAPLVVRAANEDDPVADAIIHREADSLAIGVEVLHKKLGLDDRFDVVLSGGLFSAASYYWQIVRRKILYLLPGANVISPKLEPVIGAALYALSQAEVKIDNDLLDTISRTYREFTQNAPPMPPAPESVKESAAEEPEPIGEN